MPRRQRKAGSQAHRPRPEPAEPPAAPDHGLRDAVDVRAVSAASAWTVRDWWGYLLLGKRREPTPGFTGVLEEPAAGKVGICCSGGGIRSAAFNLGALQVLQREGVLADAAYLSAVSGGSYIAAGMAMAAKPCEHDLSDPEGRHAHDNGCEDSDPALLEAGPPPFGPGSPEEQYLRNRSSYLAPGLMGKARITYRVLLGLAVNILFVGLLVGSLGAVLGWVYRESLPGLVGPAVAGATFTAAVPGWAWWTLAGLGGAGLALGLWSVLHRPRREWARLLVDTWSVRLLMLALAWALVAVAVPKVVEVLRSYDAARAAASTTAVLGAAGAAGTASVLVAILLRARAAASPAAVLEGFRGVRGFVKRLAPRLRAMVISTATALGGPLILLALLLAAVTAVLAQPEWGARSWLWPGAALAVFVAMYALADLTSWSLHPFYKRRLCSAFALKRVRDPRHPERVIAAERSYDRTVPLSETAVDAGPGKPWPTLLVCAAANISDPGATPPGRGVTSFTFSAHSIGGPLVGGMATADYEAHLAPSQRRNVTLPSAVAMSGAALSPSMGKLTRRPLRFLMALGNVRLGVWVPNPRRLDNWTKRSARGRDDCTPEDVKHRLVPRPRPSYLLRELIGWNNVNAKYLFVTDGGHYENLGLVELLRRGCTTVYCFDASGGNSLGELGDAIALARSELGVEVEVDPRDLVPTGDPVSPGRGMLAKSDCVTGKIVYPPDPRTGREEVEGTLVYIRTVLTELAPWDVHAYHLVDPAFPNHSTVDQLYTDQRFEAYRVLGGRAARHALTQAGDRPTAATPQVPTAATVQGRTRGRWLAVRANGPGRRRAPVANGGAAVKTPEAG